MALVAVDGESTGEMDSGNPAGTDELGRYLS